MNAFKQLFFGGFLQTKDNNQSIENQLENESLTEDFNISAKFFAAKNLKKTLKLIEEYVLVQELEQNTLLPTKQYLKNQTTKCYFAWKKEKFIDDLNLIRGDFLKIIEDKIEKFNKL